MRSTLCLVAINGLVLLAIMVAIEAIFGAWTGPAPRDSGFTCFDPVLHHRYCGSIAQRNRMSAVDGGQWIMTYTDPAGMMVPKDQAGQAAAIERADLILIGDSFMQADEMPWDDRMGQLIAKASGATVETVGYSS